MFNKIERLISSRNLKPKKKEGFLKVISVFSFIGIMLGVATLIIVMSVMNGFHSDLSKKILGLNPHIVIMPDNQGINKQFVNNLKDNFNEFKLSYSYNGEGVAISNEKTKGVLIKGINLNNQKNLKSIKKMIIDGNFDDFKEKTILIGSELAFDLDISLGDNLNLMSSIFINTPFGGVPKQENYKIVGIFNSGFYEFDQNMIFINLEDSLSLFDKNPRDLSLEIYLPDPMNADKYKNEIQSFNNQYYIYSWSDLNKSFFSALKVERNVMFIILTLIIIVAAFNIISGLTILIKNKTREIAILKTLGLSDISIQKSFFLTGITIGFFATVSGSILGIIFSLYIEEIRIFISIIFNAEIFPPDVYFLEKMPSEINLMSILVISLFSILISILASYFPAKAISKMNTVDGLKYE